jgi:hypothetical protein
MSKSIALSQIRTAIEIHSKLCMYLKAVDANILRLRSTMTTLATERWFVKRSGP